MAAYAALASLVQTTNLNTNQAQYFFTLDAKEKIRSIHNYVDFLLSFLKDCPEKGNRWEGKIRDAAEEIEDIVELFMWKMQSSYKRTNPSSEKLEDLLKDVTEKLGLIAGAIMEDRPAAISSSSRIALTGNDADALTGLDDDLLAIKDRLCGQSSKLQVIPIVGMGGIGKTTLAKTVYNHPLIIEHFEIRAWLTISQDYSSQRLRKFLLGLVDSMKLLGEHSDDSELKVEVFQHLKGRRYLVVMDDVWGPEVWDDVMYIFPDDKNGSRIMFTTRQLDVAAYPDPDSPLHEVRFMDEYQSWNLLEGRVFKNRYCPPKLVEVGKEIARKCLGLPLVVVLIAGVLSAVNETQASWEEIAKNVNPIVGQDLEDVLSLSYTHLPHHLRPCFLFLGGFPEDANIRASTLIKLWLAEGFLKHQNKCGQSLENEAEEYLEDLVNRNLVIVTSKKSNGKIKSCNLHGMVRGLCIRKARDEKFLHVMDGHDLLGDMMNERRISSPSSDIDKLWGSNIRTILCFQLWSFHSWQAFLQSSRLVRVLNDVGDNHKEFPSQVLVLFHLRYLALKGSLNIPPDICNLVNLQTLIIHRVKNASNLCLPLGIWKMPQLRHLVLNNSRLLPHPPNGSNLPLENLQTLSRVKNLVWNEKILQMLPNVKSLGLVYQMNEEYHLHHLKYMHQLEKLEVIGSGGFSWRGQNPCFPRTLKKLTLVGGRYPWERMGIIGSLPNLQVLKLLDYACHGDTWKTIDEEFLQLEFLLINGSHLEQWITESSHFPRLKCLVLRFCNKLREIPEGIGEISTLKLIEVDYSNKSLVESAKQIQKDQESCGNYDIQVCAVHFDEAVNNSSSVKNKFAVLEGRHNELHQTEIQGTSTQQKPEGKKGRENGNLCNLPQKRGQIKDKIFEELKQTWNLMGSKWECQWFLFSFIFFFLFFFC